MLPKIPCTITKASSTDVYGQEVFGPSKRVKCAIVTLDANSIKTSVRADSSASRGNADQITVKAVLLFSPKVDITFGDKISVSGVDLKVVGRFPRYTVMGVLDHIQVDASIWV